VETAALVQRRLGAKAAEAFFDALLGVVRVLWIDEDIHRRAEGAFRTAGRKTLSLVDCTSFEIMRAVHRVGFVFDTDFQDHGFAVLKP